MTRQLALIGGRVWTGTGRLHDAASVLLAEGRIVDIGHEVAHQPDAQVVDLRGRFVMPGFIDAHTHLALWAPHLQRDPAPATGFWAIRAAREMLASGVTTVRDLGGVNAVDIALRDAIAQGLVPGPRMLVSGKYIVPTGGHVHWWGRVADGVEEVRKAVREQIHAGVDVIKLMATGGAGSAGENPQRMHMRPEEIEAAVHEADEAGKPVAVHAHPARAIQACAEAGVTSVEHAMGLDAETIEVVLKHDMWVVPTQAAYKRMAENIDNLPESIVSIARGVYEAKVPTAQEAIKAGVRIGVGTDCSRHYPHTGYVGEMVALAEAGMSNEDVLLAATNGNAELLGLSDDIGTVEVGKRGDLVVLNADPLEDLNAAWDVHHVVQGGVLMVPTALQRSGEM
jgi:imidazolonepropionase-like amidohydrolase